MIAWIKEKHSKIDSKYPTHTKLVRYLVAGGTGAAVDLSLLYLLTDIVNLWYVLSTAIAFLVAFVVSFVMQKYMTFQDYSHDRINNQVIVYFIVAVINTMLNTFLVYLFVNYSSIHYILAQVIASIIIAIESYFIYSFLFKTKPVTVEE